MTHLPLYLQPRLVAVALLGFASGLPLALTASTLTAWLAESGVAKASIGLFAAIATPYAFKFLWAPVMDAFAFPGFAALGRRRSWMLAMQGLLMLAIAAMAFANPTLNAWHTALLGLVVATLSASQDIVIDAWRVENMAPEEQGAGAAMATLGYRVGMLVSGAGALWLAEPFRLGWEGTYLFMAGAMGMGVLTTLCLRERNPQADRKGPDTETAHDGLHPTPSANSPARVVQSPSISQRPSHPFPDSPIPAFTASGGEPRHEERVTRGKEGEGPHNEGKGFFHAHVVAPFADFMTRPHWLAVLLFVVLYKLADAFMGTMFNPFLLELGFTKSQIAEIVKIYGLAATLAGTFAGGWLVARIGMFRTLMLSGFAHMLTNFLLVVQARLGADSDFLTVSIILENFSGGMSSAAFIAYLSVLCRVNYTATQYALLSSLAAFGRTWLSTPSGWVAEKLGWEIFFAFASLLALPGLALLWWLERQKSLRAHA